MDELLQKLGNLNLRTPSVDQLVKLVIKREKAKERGRQLAAQFPFSPDKLAMLLWAKANKETLDGQKRSLGGRQVQTQSNGKMYSKVIVPADRKRDYSVWFSTQIQNAKADGSFNNYLNEANNMLAAKAKLQQVIGQLQSSNPPRYLTVDMKVYVKRMYRAGNSDADVMNWLNSLGQRVPQGTLINGKAPTRGGMGTLNPPPGITSLPAKKKYPKKK
jgi:hypothetical protein